MIYAQGTDYTVHATVLGVSGSGSQSFDYTLTDEGANTLTDESGNELIAPFIDTVYGLVIFAKGTDYTVHAES